MPSSSITVAKELAAKKLASSGLDATDAKDLGIETLSGAKTQKCHHSFKPLAALKINYYDHLGKPLSPKPMTPDFFRLRYLEEPKDFSSKTTKKPLRYVQRPNTAPVAYFPKNQEWADIVKDPDQPIIITEGELKAAKACREGFPTIGLGGVYSWRSMKLGISWLQSLDIINWVERHVYICFDSDYKTNPLVCSALKEFGDQCEHRGAYPYCVTLPNLSGLDKVGLDDFLVHAGPNAVDMFAELLTEAEPLGLAKPLRDLNSKYAYVTNPGLIIHQKELYKTTASAFKDHLESSARYAERQLRKDGTVSYKTVSAAAAWLQWPHRMQVAKLTYEPGKDKFINTNGGRPKFNIWPGWGLQPKKGDPKPFLALVDHLFTGADKGAKEWFLSWCAYPLQYPGLKMFSSVVIHGVRHGTGKSLLGLTLGRIYGKNFTEISQMDLHNSFNEWAESKQFVMGDDVTGSNKRQDADFLKKLITQRELRVNGKYVPTYVVPDCINYFFTAQQSDSFFLEDDDRRFFINEVTVGPLSEEFYVDFNLWVDSGGAAAIFYYLKNYDTKDFNPAAAAFKTAAKERMITNIQSDLATWVRQVLTNPDHVLRVGTIPIEKDLFTSKELLSLYDPGSTTNVTANGVGREMARAGFAQVGKGRPFKIADGSQQRYYILRNNEKWRMCNSALQIRQHLEGWMDQKVQKRKKKY